MRKRKYFIFTPMLGHDFGLTNPISRPRKHTKHQLTISISNLSAWNLPQQDDEDTSITPPINFTHGDRLWK
jgi:hypothetical protein